MRRLLLSTGVVLTLLFLNVNLVSGKTSTGDDTGESYPVPAELPLKVDTSYIDICFFPIGWSKHGHFAYAGIAPPEGSEYSSVRYGIYDMKTDSCLWVHDDYGEYPDSYAETMRKSWVTQRNIVEVALRRYGIAAGSAGKFLTFPFRYGDDSLSADMELLREHECDGNPVVEASIYIVSVNKGKKRIAHELYRCDIPRLAGRSIVACDRMSIIGALVSPFEPRMAVICGYVKVQEETWRYDFYGSHIVTGFGKKPSK